MFSFVKAQNNTPYQMTVREYYHYVIMTHEQNSGRFWLTFSFSFQANSAKLSNFYDA